MNKALLLGGRVPLGVGTLVTCTAGGLIYPSALLPRPTLCRP